MFDRKDYVDYLMLELDKFQSWYTAERGFGGNKSMLQIFEGVLTALTIINFDGLPVELRDSINKIKEIGMIMRKQSGRPQTDYSSHAVALCYKALSILVNKLK